MVVEMPDNDGNVRIPRLSERLPIVHTLQHTEQTLVLLDVARYAEI